MHLKLARELIPTALLAVACGLALSACGSSGKKHAATPHTNVMVAFSECMRAHGLPSFPDPSTNGGGLNLGGTGINPQAPSFQRAQTACRKLLPGGGPSTHASAEDIKQATETAECMRKHGITGYPDPIVTSKPPAVNPNEYSSATYGNGIFIGIPKSINANSPAFIAAAKVCDAR